MHLAVLIDFLSVADRKAHLDKLADDSAVVNADETGDKTIEALNNCPR